MRVFVSSVITGFEPFREAAVEAARVLRHEVIRSENFPALALTPQQACLEGVRESDVVLLLLGSRYGDREPSGKAATEEEFEEAVRSKPVLVFDQVGVDRDRDMAEFVGQVQDWAGGTVTASFASPADLRDCVMAALAEHAVREQAGRIDDEELVERARALLPADRHVLGDELVVVVASGPTGQVLRPAEIEDPRLCEQLKEEAMFGTSRVLDSGQGARCRLEGDALVIANDAEQIVIDQLGSVAVSGPARRVSTSLTGLNPLIEEDVREAISASLRFAGTTLEQIDPSARLSVVAPLVALRGSPIGWRTRAEQQASPNAMSLGMGSTREHDSVTLSPQSRPRRYLILNADELAEDFAVLLRRQFS